MTWCDCWCNFSVRIDACYEQPRRQDEAFGDRKFCFSSIFKLLGCTERSFPVFCVKPWKSPALQEFQISHSGVSATLPLLCQGFQYKMKLFQASNLIKNLFQTFPPLERGKKHKKQETSHLFLLHLPPLCLQVLLGVSLQNHVYMQWVLLLVNNIAIAEPP